MSESIKAPIARNSADTTENVELRKDKPGNVPSQPMVVDSISVAPDGRMLQQEPITTENNSSKRIYELESEITELRRALASSQDSLNVVRNQLIELQEHENLSALMQEMALAMQQRDEKLHEYVAELVSAATANVLGKALTSPEYAISAITNVLDKCSSDAVVSIKVSQRDYQTMNKFRSQFPGFPFERLEVSGDISVGGCQVFTPTGLLDGALESQLFALRQMLGGKR